MAALPESGSAKGFFLLKGSRREVSVQSAVFELALYVWIGQTLNLINWIWLDYDYNEFDSNWLELDCIIEVLWDDICCDLVLYK